MDFLMINPQNIKISITNDELSASGISSATLDYKSSKVKRLIWRILDKAQEKLGFCTDGKKLYISAFCTNEGCELFISTKNGENAKGCDSLICYFSSTEPLFLLCERLKSINYCGSNCLFVAKKGYFKGDLFALVLSRKKPLPSYIKNVDSEYGLDFVCEYCNYAELDKDLSLALELQFEKLCDNAVGKICKTKK